LKIPFNTLDLTD